MKILCNIDHTFDLPVGDVGVTVRKGDKWLEVKEDTLLELWNCKEGHSGNCSKERGCQYCGQGYIIGTWYGDLDMLPPSLLAIEHNVSARDREVLWDMLKKAYGDIDNYTKVTALIYGRYNDGKD